MNAIELSGWLDGKKIDIPVSEEMYLHFLKENGCKMFRTLKDIEKKKQGGLINEYKFLSFHLIIRNHYYIQLNQMVMVLLLFIQKIL